MSKFRIVTTKCRRCGRQVGTGNKSLWGNDKAKAKLDRICSDCITPEEREAIRSLRPKT